MVKEGNFRLMVTVGQKTKERMDELCQFYDMTPTELFKFMVGLFHQERINKR